MKHVFLLFTLLPFYLLELTAPTRAAAETYHPDKFFAHRGMLRFAPENTLLSFEIARERGFTKFELDISAAADNMFLVYHDLSLKRIFERKTRLCELHGKTVRELRPGAFFLRENFALPDDTIEKLKTIEDPWLNKLFAEQIPNLEEVFRRFGSGVYYHLDIKRLHCKGSRQEAIGRLVQLIRKYDLASRIYLESKDLALLQDAHTAEPSLMLMYWNEEVFNASPERIEELKRSGVTSLDFYYGNYKEQLADKLSAFTLHAYTLNGASTIKAFYSKLDFIITDDDVLQKRPLDKFQFFNSRSRRVIFVHSNGIEQPARNRVLDQGKTHTLILK